PSIVTWSTIDSASISGMSGRPLTNRREEDHVQKPCAEGGVRRTSRVSILASHIRRPPLDIDRSGGFAQKAASPPTSRTAMNRKISANRLVELPGCGPGAGSSLGNLEKKIRVTCTLSLRRLTFRYGSIPKPAC